jgi:hypothetical protein
VESATQPTQLGGTQTPTATPTSLGGLADLAEVHTEVVPLRGGRRMPPFGTRRIVSCWQGQQHLNEGNFVVLSRDSCELKIADFLVTQIPAQMGASQCGNDQPGFGVHSVSQK